MMKERLKRLKPSFYRYTNYLWYKGYFKIEVFKFTYMALQFKEKYGSLRVEYVPRIHVTFFNLSVDIYFGTEDDWLNHIDKKYGYEN